jgi:hypothetical protein
MQKQALEAIEVAEARREAAERELAFKMEENRKLLVRLFIISAATIGIRIFNQLIMSPSGGTISSNVSIFAGG